MDLPLLRFSIISLPASWDICYWTNPPTHGSPDVSGNAQKERGERPRSQKKKKGKSPKRNPKRKSYKRLTSKRKEKPISVLFAWNGYATEFWRAATCFVQHVCRECL